MFWGGVAGLTLAACATRGSTWINQPLTETDEGEASHFEPPPERRARPSAERYRVRVIGGEEEPEVAREQRIDGERLQGRVLGIFRNTYYDFPSEGEYSGDEVTLFDSRCEPIKAVNKGFHDRVCVQGSGLLSTGTPISFARRDCECAARCPKTDQRICFDALDKLEYPWGRGALGKPITPLLTVAVDDSVIPMQEPIYIPEYDGLPRDPEERSFHDGCFIAQDRGMRVKGRHVDIFTGHSSITLLYNRLVPSNQGVTVVLDSPRCQRAEGVSLSASSSESP